MPTYDFYCPHCGWSSEQIVPIRDRDNMLCPSCISLLQRRLAAPLGKIAGTVTPGGGPDRFTADMLGIPPKELPSGLRTTEPTS